jgi:dTDP-4-amino-4,6-dideoxygalactose transaminase
MITIAAPEIGEEEIKAVNEVLNSGMLAQGPKVAELEEAFARYCGAKYALALNSGTAAIHAALAAIGVGPGDEVITTPFSFIATINPIIFLGAKPVLADIDPETFNIDTSKLEALITSKTKAIMPVHLYGQPCDHGELSALAAKHGLKVIEDACQAVGAEYDGKKAGNLGDVGCFSLYATKNIMSGEGGMITTNDEAIATRVRQFRQHGMSGPYQYEGIGYNYRMTDLQAAIANEQLKKVNRFNEARRRNAKLFDEGLRGITGLGLPKVAAKRTHVYHQYTIRVLEDFPLERDALIDELKKREIGAAVYYPKSLHDVPHIAAYGYKAGDFPESEKAASQVLSLPIHPKVSESDIQTIITALKEIAGVS